MNTRTIKSLVVAKVALLSIGGYFLYAHYTNKTVAEANSETKPSDTSKDSVPAQTKTSAKENSAGLPSIPQGMLSASEAAKIRYELELIRKDTENKIERLKIAKSSYDQSRSEVEAKLKKIEEERRLLEDTLQKEKKAKEERLAESIEHLAKMEPRKAAPILEGMDRDLVVLALKKLPPKTVTKILEAMSPKKATEFLEYYTRIRSGREFDLLKQLGLCQPQEQIEPEKNAPK